MSVTYRPSINRTDGKAALQIDINGTEETNYEYVVSTGKVTGTARPNPAILAPEEYGDGIRGTHDMIALTVAHFAPVDAMQPRALKYFQARPLLNRNKIEIDRKANGNIEMAVLIGQGVDKIDYSASYDAGTGLVTVAARPGFVVSLPEFQMWTAAMKEQFWLIVGHSIASW